MYLHQDHPNLMPLQPNKSLTRSSHSPSMDTPATFSAFCPLSPKSLGFPLTESALSAQAVAQARALPGLRTRRWPVSPSAPTWPQLLKSLLSAAAPVPSARSRPSLSCCPGSLSSVPPVPQSSLSAAAPFPSARSRLSLSCGPGSLSSLPPAPQLRSRFPQLDPARPSAAVQVPSARSRQPLSCGPGSLSFRPVGATTTRPLSSRPSAEALPRTVAPPPRHAQAPREQRPCTGGRGFPPPRCSERRRCCSCGASRAARCASCGSTTSAPTCRAAAPCAGPPVLAVRGLPAGG